MMPVWLKRAARWAIVAYLLDRVVDAWYDERSRFPLLLCALVLGIAIGAQAIILVSEWRP